VFHKQTHDRLQYGSESHNKISNHKRSNVHVCTLDVNLNQIVDIKEKSLLN